jgi:hypothetical protein
MRISELSKASGVSIPTIKFYLREGLLPQGRLVAANQANYEEDRHRPVAIPADRSIGRHQRTHRRRGGPDRVGGPDHGGFRRPPGVPVRGRRARSARSLPPGGRVRADHVLADGLPGGGHPESGVREHVGIHDRPAPHLASSVFPPCRLPAGLARGVRRVNPITAIVDATRGLMLGGPVAGPVVKSVI